MATSVSLQAVNFVVASFAHGGLSLRAKIYCGIPAGLDAIKIANEALKDIGKVSAAPAKKS